MSRIPRPTPALIVAVATDKPASGPAFAANTSHTVVTISNLTAGVYVLEGQATLQIATSLRLRPQPCAS